jgi:hypothetical protein
MAINNYINLQRNDFFSPYLDGISNFKKAFSPQSTTNIYNSDRTITPIPFSLEDRVCHFVSGIGLIIPVVNLIISCALRYFATQNLPAVRSTASAHTAMLPAIATSQVLPSAPAAASALAVIDTDSDQRALSGPLNITDNDRHVPEVAGSNVSEAQHASSGASTLERNRIPAAAIIPSIERPQVLPLAASTESLSAVIDIDSGQRSLSAPLDTTHNDRHVTAQAAAYVSEPQHASSAAATLQVLDSPEVLSRVASRRAERILHTVVDLPKIPEEGEVLDTDSLPSADEPRTLGAGVLLYRWHLGAVEILIGRNRADGKWSYFGGDSIGDEPPMHTAARKCEEVTGGFLGRQSSILPHLSEIDRIGGAYKTYFMKGEDRSITAERFLEPRKAVAKTQIAWVKIQDLLSVSRQANNRLKIEGSQGELHPSFRATLQSPSSQDVLRKISSIQSSGRLHGVSSFASQRSGKVA